MQPEPTSVSQNALSPEVAPETRTPSSQHGLQDAYNPLSLLPHIPEEQREQYFVRTVGQDATRDVGYSGDLESARLSPASPSPRNRVADYENAMAQSPRKKNEGPAFDVIKSVRKPDDKSCPILNLPNGESLLRYICPEATLLMPAQRY